MQQVILYQESLACCIFYLLFFLILTTYLKNNIPAQVVPGIFTVKDCFIRILQHGDKEKFPQGTGIYILAQSLGYSEK